MYVAALDNWVVSINLVEAFASRRVRGANLSWLRPDTFGGCRRRVIKRKRQSNFSTERVWETVGEACTKSTRYRVHTAIRQRHIICGSININEPIEWSVIKKETHGELREPDDKMSKGARRTLRVGEGKENGQRANYTVHFFILCLSLSLCLPRR